MDVDNKQITKRMLKGGLATFYLLKNEDILPEMNDALKQLLFLLKQTVAWFYSFLNLVRPPSLNLGLYSRRESPSRPFSGF